MTELLNRYLVPVLRRLSENTYLSAIRAGMIAIVPLTIIGGLFLVVSEMPAASWQAWVTPYKPLLEIPVSATFGLLAVFVCFAIAYDLAKQFRLEASVSAAMATLVFLMVQLQRGEAMGDEAGDLFLNMGGLGSEGLFTAILIALVSVRFQALLRDANLVIRLPKSVPSVVYESFLSLVPMLGLVIGFWILRFVLDVDINRSLQILFSPLMTGLNTLPGILTFTFFCTLFWSIGINGDNTLDAVVGPIFLAYLAGNVEAAQANEPLPYITALGFITSFVNVGGTGATIALALVMFFSRAWLPANQSYFHAHPDLPDQRTHHVRFSHRAQPGVHGSFCHQCHVTDCRHLYSHGPGLDSSAGDSCSMDNAADHWSFLVSGGDWRAALWGLVSIVLAMGIYYPFAKAAERQRMSSEVPQSPSKHTPEQH